MWQAIGRLETIRQIALYDYAGTEPTAGSLWWQVADVRAVCQGRDVALRCYRGVVRSGT